MVETQAAVVAPSVWRTASGGKASAGTRVWLWFNLLSLDAPLVAVVWQRFFARCYGVSLRWPAVFSLALSVWVIYAVDRLLDARDATPLITARHSFARRYRRTLSFTALGALLSLVWVSSHLSRAVIINGLSVGFGVAVYFLAVHAAPPWMKRLWPKELAVGLIFAMGTSLVVWSRMTADRREFAGAALLFAALCWLNCVAIEYWEWRRMESAAMPRDAIEGPHLWTRWVGRRLPQATLAVAIASLLLVSYGAPPPVAAAVAISAAALLWLEWRSAVLSLDLLRVLADAALLSPALLLPFYR